MKNTFRAKAFGDAKNMKIHAKTAVILPLESSMELVPPMALILP
jgi:hypothetical protein